MAFVHRTLLQSVPFGWIYPLVLEISGWLLVQFFCSCETLPTCYIDSQLNHTEAKHRIYFRGPKSVKIAPQLRLVRMPSMSSFAVRGSDPGARW